MTDDRWVERQAAHQPSDAAIDVGALAMAGRAVHEGRRAHPAHEGIDASDLFKAAMERGVELRLDRCVPPASAPHSVVTCARRVLQLAIDAFGRFDFVPMAVRGDRVTLYRWTFTKEVGSATAAFAVVEAASDLRTATRRAGHTSR